MQGEKTMPSTSAFYYYPWPHHQIIFLTKQWDILTVTGPQKLHRTESCLQLDIGKEPQPRNVNLCKETSHPWDLAL